MTVTGMGLTITLKSLNKEVFGLVLQNIENAAMKAMLYEKYGGPENLRLIEVDKPKVGDDEVLVRVQAASINSWDWDLLTGKPKVYRLLFGLFRPKHRIMGSDIAGTVEVVGSNVKHIRPGDEVFGDISGSGFGAFAEYACGPGNVLALKTATMDFDGAAAIPQAGVLALQGLRKGKLASGMKVLINGGGGGVGTFAIQLSKLEGAEVTAVDTAEKLELMKSMGARHLIDYTKQDFTKADDRYDLILDVMANRPVSHYRRVMKDGGKAVIIGGTPSTLITLGILGAIGSPKVTILGHKPKREDLDYLAGLLESGKLRPVIDRTYPLEELPSALRYFGSGKVKGKIVISM